MNRSLTFRLLLIAMSAAALASCGDDPPPAEPDVAVVAEVAAPAERTEPVVTPAQRAAAVGAPPHVAQSEATIPAEVVGMAPPKNIQDAYVLANRVIDEYCNSRGIGRETFYVKESVMEGPNYKILFYGSPNGEGQYVSVIVRPDGVSEILK
jgi:hypothetical protein